MKVLALDIGTTQWKAGIYDAKGRELSLRLVPAKAHTDGDGVCVYDPGELAEALRGLIGSLPEKYRRDVRSVALTGMAEGGLIQDPDTGEALSTVLSWLDKRGEGPFRKLSGEGFLRSRYAVTGLPNHPKYSVYKLLALLPPGRKARWLGVPEYAAWLLTGKAATVNSLAARTYAYDLLKGKWDEDFLDRLQLARDVFAPLAPAGAPIGELRGEWGLHRGAQVCICGHDHLCAAYGVHAQEPGEAFASLGTAMAIMAPKPQPGLTEADLATGLSFGPALAGDGLTALGSAQAAGGSVTLAGRLLFPGRGYAKLLKAAGDLLEGPGSIVYLPYLSGSGAPHLDPSVRGAFLGLDGDTSRERLLLSVYEGIACEARVILEALGGAKELAACGGLSAHPRLMQVLADILNLPVRVPDIREGTLLGAARLAFFRAGMALNKPTARAIYHPRNAPAYDQYFKERYLPMRQAVLQCYPS